MGRSPRLLRALLPALAAAALLGAGCGGDDENSGLTVPTSAPTTTDTTGKTGTDGTQTAPQNGQGAGGGGGDTGSSGGTRAPSDPSKPDSPENDVPPPKGSPAERFEQECQVNPSACQ